MTTTAPGPGPGTTDRSLRLHRRLLALYPREFRSEYGEDVLQGYRDLLTFGPAGRTTWWRSARDLLAGAARERGAALLPGGRPPLGVAALVVVVLVASVLVGPGPLLPLVALPVVVLIGLPVFGVSRLHRAWVERRSTGGPVGRTVALGLASFLPAIGALLWAGPDAGYWVFISVALALIVGSAVGTVWALVTLITADRDRPRAHRWRRPLLILVPSLAILGVIIGASYNSYRQSLGPPGDHSVENASPDTRALWQAAGTAQVDEVLRLTTETCADPWVKFPVGDGRHNAKGYAETRMLEVPESMDPPYDRIADVLGDYMDGWYDRCGPTDEP